MTRLYRRSRASRDAAMWAAVARDQRADLTEKPWSVAEVMADEARDPANESRHGARRIGDRWVDEANLPTGDEL